MSTLTPYRTAGQRERLGRLAHAIPPAPRTPPKPPRTPTNPPQPPTPIPHPHPHHFFFKQKTAYEILRSDWSSDVCSSD
eukprot:COSAG01_NODE_44853_length_415_cov_0.449367_2_plen_78_part_01